MWVCTVYFRAGLFKINKNVGRCHEKKGLGNMGHFGHFEGGQVHG
jgi:hypothetical protein